MVSNSLDYFRTLCVNLDNNSDFYLKFDGK